MGGEEQLISSAQQLVSYGALGICTAFFMVKDWIRGKRQDEVIEKNTEVIKDFTVALNVLVNQIKK